MEKANAVLIYQCASLGDSCSFALCQFQSSPLVIGCVDTWCHSSVEFKRQQDNDWVWQWNTQSVHAKKQQLEDAFCTSIPDLLAYLDSKGPSHFGTNCELYLITIRSWTIAIRSWMKQLDLGRRWQLATNFICNIANVASYCLHPRSNCYRILLSMVTRHSRITSPVNCMFVLALGNNSHRFAVRIASHGQLSIQGALTKSCIQSMCSLTILPNYTKSSILNNFPSIIFTWPVL